jgi:hypothetical protein
MEQILLFALLLCDYRFENKWPFVPLIDVFVIFDLCVYEESPPEPEFHQPFLHFLHYKMAIKLYYLYLNRLFCFEFFFSFF